MLYYACRFHHFTPVRWYGMGYGERKAYTAILHYEIAKINEENKAAGGDNE